MNTTSWKRFVLVALMFALLCFAAGCFIKPDPMDEALVGGNGSISPSPTETVLSLPSSTVVVDYSAWATNAPSNDESRTVPSVSPDSSTSMNDTSSASSVSASEAAVSSGILKEGAKGQQVRDLQQRLLDLGYYAGQVDGSFGPGTTAAIKDFQRANNLSSDGIAGPETIEVLYSTRALSKSAFIDMGKNATDRPSPREYNPSTPGTYRYLQVGSEGAGVKELQNRLKTLGYFAESANGVFGQNTKVAVEAFQKRNGLWVDGVAGEDTQKMLYSDDALPSRN